MDAPTPTQLRDFVKSLLDGIWNKGHCPKIIIDATHKDVEIPEYVREEWGARLALNLVASDPLDPGFDDDALRLTLAFRGHVVRCTFPWNRIYMVADRETGQGAVIQTNLPEGVRSTATPPRAIVETLGEANHKTDPAPPPVAKRPNPFRVIPGGKKN